MAQHLVATTVPYHWAAGQPCPVTSQFMVGFLSGPALMKPGGSIWIRGTGGLSSLVMIIAGMVFRFTLCGAGTETGGSGRHGRPMNGTYPNVVSQNIGLDGMRSDENVPTAFSFLFQGYEVALVMVTIHFWE